MDTASAPIRGLLYHNCSGPTKALCWVCALATSRSCVLYLGKDLVPDERVQGAFDDEIDRVVEPDLKVIREIDFVPTR